MQVSEASRLKGSGSQVSSMLRVKSTDHSTIGVLQSLKGYLTNLSYQIDGINLLEMFAKDSKQSQQRNEDHLYFLCGRQYQKQEDCLKENEKLIWFTYRKNFNLADGFSSDIGWGCLIRVAQMALAQSLRVFFKTGSNDLERSYIINAFLEEKGADTKYNLQKFTKKGSQLWSKRPGQWYSMTEAATTLKALHEQNPLKGSQNLKIKVYNQIIDVQEVLSALGYLRCSCDSSKIYCSSCQSLPQDNNLSSSRKRDRRNKQVLLMLTTNLGKTQVTSQSYDDLLLLIELPFFSGCLGGVPKKARFITGKQGKKLSYLDPHYVQQSVDRLTLHINKDTFSCKQYRLMGRDELSPHMTVCFHLRNSEDLQVLVDTIDSIKRRKTVSSDGEDEEIVGYEFNTPRIIPRPKISPQREEGIPLNFQDIDRSSKESQQGVPSADLSFLME